MIYQPELISMNKQLIRNIHARVKAWVLKIRNTKFHRGRMIRHKHLSKAFAVIATGSLGLSAFILPLQVRSEETGKSCEIVIMNAKKRIEQEREITVMTNVIDGSEKYPSHPLDRPTIINVLVEGSAADSIMVSPVFQKAVASEIIKSCTSVGAVTFGRYQTGWTSTVGLIREGSIQHFECLDDYDERGPSQVPWGQEWCSL
jgi:hypothetical protein